jgi:hypothetical protein
MADAADKITSASFQRGMPSLRPLAEVRAIRARRAQIAQAYRAEGRSESYIAAHVTDHLAALMIAHDRNAKNLAAGVFLGGAL